MVADLDHLGVEAGREDGTQALQDRRRQLDVVHAAEGAYRAGAVPIASAEGFIRQVLGWREYVWGVYWREMPDYRTVNALGATRPLPPAFTGAPTSMRCVEVTLGDVRRHGWAHHIQRLMVTGLFALLLGVEPRRVHETRVPGVKIITNVLSDPAANPSQVVAAQRAVDHAAPTQRHHARGHQRHAQIHDLFGREPGQIVARSIDVQHDRSRLGFDHAHDAFHERALAVAVGAQQHHRLSLIEFERHAHEGAHRAVAGVDGLDV